MSALQEPVQFALMCVLEGNPDAAIEIAPQTFVRAGFLVAALSPELQARADAFVAQEALRRKIGTAA